MIPKDYDNKDKEEIYLDLIPCTESLGTLNEPLDDKQTEAMEGALCLPIGQDILKGSNLHGAQKKIDIVYQSCEGDGCMSPAEMDAWFEEKQPELELLYAHNFIDFLATDEYFRRSITF